MHLYICEKIPQTRESKVEEYIGTKTCICAFWHII